MTTAVIIFILLFETTINLLLQTKSHFTINLIRLADSKQPSGGKHRNVRFRNV